MGGVNPSESKTPQSVADSAVAVLANASAAKELLDSLDKDLYDMINVLGLYIKPYEDKRNLMLKQSDVDFYNELVWSRDYLIALQLKIRDRLGLPPAEYNMCNDRNGK